MPTLFDLAGGHPALDLVNSLDNRFRADGPNEMLTGFEELARFLQETRLITPDQAQRLKKKPDPATATRALQAARELREASAAVFYAVAEDRSPLPKDIETLGRYFRQANSQSHLCWDQGAGWQWNDEQSNPGFAVWILTESVRELLFSHQIAHLRTCDMDTCRWLFLDTSKNHSRRWCNMKVCGNRVKARRFQARRDS